MFFLEGQTNIINLLLNVAMGQGWREHYLILIIAVFSVLLDQCINLIQLLNIFPFVRDKIQLTIVLHFQLVFTGWPEPINELVLAKDVKLSHEVHRVAILVPKLRSISS